MNPPTIKDLPPPPEGKKGWPWTEGCEPLPPLAPNGKAWPSISLVTPSYNQGRYIEETIRSILLQGYPNLEYFILDGGSTDDAVSIIKKYERWLTGWVSQKDKGQSDAVNKGFAQSHGEIFNWICSDDVVTKGALELVGKTFAIEPQYDVVAGGCYCIYEDRSQPDGVKPSLKERLERMPYAFAIWQPSCFYRRSLIARSDLLLTEMVYCMDRELWCYLCAQGGKWKFYEEALSVNRYTGVNKSMVGKDKIVVELDEIYRAYIKERVPLTFWLRKVWLPIVRAHNKNSAFPIRLFYKFLSKALSFNLHLIYSRDRVRVLQEEFYGYTTW